jgi:tetratricopeptide (TPR) repeat protein
MLASSLNAQAPTQPATPPAAPGGLTSDAPDLQTAVQKAYEDGFALMNEGKFKEAIEKVEFIKSKMTTVPPDVIFLEAICAFNMQDYNRSAASFEKYIKDYSGQAETNLAIKDIMPKAKLGLARSYMQINKGEEGIKLLKEVAGDPLLKAEAGLLLAFYYRKEKKDEEALKVLESVVADGVHSAEQIQSALMAAEIYVAAGQGEKASTLLEKIKGGATSGDNAAQMNNISQQLGDKMLAEKRYSEALSAYRSVRKKSEFIRLMKEREARLKETLAKDPSKKDVIQAKIDAEKSILDELEKKSDYDATLYYRLGRCYFEMQRYWEAVLAFGELVKQFKDYPQRDKAMYGMIIANASLKRTKVAKDLAEKFIAEFPESTEVGAITELYVMLAYQSGNLDEAVKAADRALGFPKADKERLSYLKANIYFEKQAFQDAVTNYEIMMQEFPKSAYADDAKYRIALCYFYQNDSKAVRKAMDSYIKDFPKGQYVIDAKYRLAFIRFQAGETEDAMRDLIALINESPNDPNIGQVYTLLGDGYNKMAQTQPDLADDHYNKAIEAYENGYSKAQTADVKRYARDSLTDLYQANDRYSDLIKMYQTELEVNKDKDPEAVMKAIYHITSGLRRENKLDEAKKLLAENIRPYINNPTMDQVEVLIQQLCQYSAPKKRRIVTAEEAVRIREEAEKRLEEAKAAAMEAEKKARAEGKPVTPFVPPSAGGGVTTQEELNKEFEKLDEEIQKLLTPPNITPAGNSRILFARGYLASTMRLPASAEKIWGIMVEVAKPDELSPYLLSVVGDAARKKKDYEKASACYIRLKDVFMDSQFADGSLVGLGEICFEKGEYDKALDYFNEATSEKMQGSSRLLDAELGKGKTLVKLNKLDQATTQYETIARTKEWKVAHAEALFGLGQIQEVKKEYPAALSYYIRIYVAHQKYKDWMAKSYLQAARTLIVLNKKDEAKQTLQEMLKRQELKIQPEYQLAQQELSRLN